MNVTIESRHKGLTVGGEEEGRCGCGVGVIHGGIPHGEACPPARGAHGGGSQYPPEGGGDRYPPGGGNGGHIGGCPAMGHPPHSITGGGPV
jgi:hypothetical protein